MSAGDLFGWDLLYKTVKAKVANESDLVVALVHWFLVRNAFRCIGVGDDKTLGENEEGTELLPDGWNDNEDSYALRYVSNDNLFNLLAAKTEGTIIINILDIKTKKVSNIALDPKETVKSLEGSIRVMVPQINELMDRFKKELIDPVFSGNTKEVTTQTRPSSSTQSTSPTHQNRCFPRHMSSDPLVVNSNRPHPLDPLRNIGRGDLDPLGGGAGGMIFSPPPLGPFGSNFLPGPPGQPGSRIPPPPGARYDPFGPPDGNTGRTNPNPNHFPPPPDFDDMYM